MLFKSKGFQLTLAFGLGLIVLLLPRPEGTQFRIVGDANQRVLPKVSAYFAVLPDQESRPRGYLVTAIHPGAPEATRQVLLDAAASVDKSIEVEYMDGLPPKAKRFLAKLATLVICPLCGPPASSLIPTRRGS